jgi:hypothetical protein
MRSRFYHPFFSNMINELIGPNGLVYINKDNFNATLDFTEFSRDKIILINNCTFNPLTIINPNNLQIIFVNCQGRVNFVYKTNPSIINTLKNAVCPACPKMNCPELKCPACPKMNCPELLCNCPKVTCPKQQECPKVACPNCPKQQECPKEKFPMCPSCPKQQTCPKQSCPKQTCPVCSADDDDDY